MITVARSAKGSRRGRLSAERIEGEALALIEREGLAAFSTRKLAAALGCEAMSIYHYFPSKGHLMDALVDRVIGEMPPVPEPGPPWEVRARRLARDWRRVATARPNFYILLVTHRLNTRKGLAWLNAMLGFCGEAGLSREEGVRLFRAFGYYLMGAGLDETVGYARGPSTVEPVPDDEMKRDYPNVVEAGRYFGTGEHERTFDLGLDIFLDGVRALVERRRGETGAGRASARG